jgi:hypothetical protein
MPRLRRPPPLLDVSRRRRVEHAAYLLPNAYPAACEAAWATCNWVSRRRSQSRASPPPASAPVPPATKAQPKEMLPLVDKPIIQYGVEEAVASGVDNIILVTGRGKNAIEDHFDVSVELETFLEARGKRDSSPRSARSRT